MIVFKLIGWQMYEGHVDHITRHAVQGWAFDTTRPGQSIDVTVALDGKVIARATANKPRPDLAAQRQLQSASYGFVAAIPRFLNTAAPHFVQVRFADTGQLIANGERCFPTLDDYDAVPDLMATQGLSLTPLFLTHMPRSGSTLCMALLHCHPSIVIADSYPFEVKPATYYARAARLLTEPGNHELSGSPTEFMRSHMHLGFNPFNHLSFDQIFKDGRLRDHFFERSARKALFGTLRTVSKDYYRHLAADQHKRAAVYFAEKCEIQGTTRQSLLALFPDAREILLVRDPRDVLCSFLSYFKRPTSDDLLRNLRNGCEAIRQIANGRRKRTFVVKYESLVFDQRATLEGVERFMQLDGAGYVWPDGRIVNPEIFKKHATAASAEQSVGRWKIELSGSQKNACAQAFGRFLSEFRYDDVAASTPSDAADTPS